jgi:hypothetical protein
MFLAGLFAFAVASFYIPEPPTPQAMALSGLFTWGLCAWLAARVTRVSGAVAASKIRRA